MKVQRLRLVRAENEPMKVSALNKQLPLLTLQHIKILALRIFLTRARTLPSTLDLCLRLEYISPAFRAFQRQG